MSGRRVLVTGSRTWTDTRTIRDALGAVWGDGRATLVVGACPRGADLLAEQCWRAWGGHVERHPAQWHEHGRSAGFRRNETMVRAGADHCIAFIRDASAGASHTAQLAENAGIPTQRVSHPAPSLGPEDLDLMTAIVRRAENPGYRVVECSRRVFRVVPGSHNAVEDVPRHEAETILAMIDAHDLDLGHRYTVAYGDHAGPAREIVIPHTTRRDFR